MTLVVFAQNSFHLEIAQRRKEEWKDLSQSMTRHLGLAYASPSWKLEHQGMVIVELFAAEIVRNRMVQCVC